MSDNLPVIAEPTLDELTATPALHSIRAALRHAGEPIRAALLEADDRIREAIATRDIEELAYLLRGVRAIREALLRPILDDIAVLDRSAEDAIVGIMDSTYVETEVGLLHRRKSGGSTTWDGPGLLSRLSMPLIEGETGERVDAIPLDILMAVLPQATAKSAAFKVTGLKEQGIDPDEWKFTIGDRYTVVIEKEAP